MVRLFNHPPEALVGHLFGDGLFSFPAPRRPFLELPPLSFFRLPPPPSPTSSLSFIHLLTVSILYTLFCSLSRPKQTKTSAPSSKKVLCLCLSNFCSPTTSNCRTKLLALFAISPSMVRYFFRPLPYPYTRHSHTSCVFGSRAFILNPSFLNFTSFH